VARLVLMTGMMVSFAIGSLAATQLAATQGLAAVAGSVAEAGF